MSGAYNRTRFLAAAVKAVVGMTLTGWSSVLRAAPLLPSGLNSSRSTTTTFMRSCLTADARLDAVGCTKPCQPGRLFAGLCGRDA